MNKAFPQCPRCQAIEPLRNVYECRKCFAQCCDKCLDGELPPDLKGAFLPFGYVHRGCPGCRAGLDDRNVIGRIETPMLFGHARTPSLPSSPPPPLSPEAQERAREIAKETEASAARGRIVDRGNGTSCGLNKSQMHLLPEVAAKRGDEVVFLELWEATDADLQVVAAHAAQFPRLRNIWLEQSPGVTDAGIAALAAVTTLQDLVLKGDMPHLTPAGIKALHAGARRCNVQGGPKPWWKFW